MSQTDRTAADVESAAAETSAGGTSAAERPRRRRATGGTWLPPDDDAWAEPTSEKRGRAGDDVRGHGEYSDEWYRQQRPPHHG